MKKYISILLSLTLLVGCSAENQEILVKQTEEIEVTHVYDEPITDEFENDEIFEETEPEIKSNSQILLESMTLERKIGQLFIVRLSSLQTRAVSTIVLNDDMIEQMRKYQVGGIVIFSDDIASEEQLKTLISDFNKHSEIAPFISIDEEGGNVARLANSENLDISNVGNMGKVGKTDDTQNAYDIGVTIGEYLSDFGFNLNYAPVVDINSNPNNSLIGNRSFGSDAELVSSMATSEIEGLHEQGIMACIKHFPGHGDTKGDTHDGYVSIDKTWEELLECELIPFIDAQNTTDMVMVSHITTPNITEDNLPSSLSFEMISEKLRGELGYQGVVITDALEMGAIVNDYSADKVAVLSVLAGVDIMLMPEDFSLAFDGLCEAVLTGVIDVSVIDQAVLRILELKDEYGLLQNSF